MIVLGDLNDFGFTPPADLLRAGATPEADLTVLLEQLTPQERYSYAFAWERPSPRSEMLVSPVLADVLVLGSYHVAHFNAEFADHASDHDPPGGKLPLAGGVGSQTPCEDFGSSGRSRPIGLVDSLRPILAVREARARHRAAESSDEADIVP